jgi:hypothetical protein
MSDAIVSLGRFGIFGEGGPITYHTFTIKNITPLAIFL